MLGVELVVMAGGDLHGESKPSRKVDILARLPGIQIFSHILVAIFRRCNFVTNSRYLAEAYAKNYGMEQTTVIHRGVKVEEFDHYSKTSARMHLKLAPFPDNPDFDRRDQRLIMSATNFRYVDKARGMVDILPDMDRLLKEYPDLVWIVAGKGPWLETFRRIVKDKIEHSDRVRFPGHVHLPLYIAACEFFVHCSHLDGYPRVILEAQAQSKPVIGNRAVGVTEMIRHGETGFLIGPDDSFHDCAKRLLDDPELLQSIGKKARAHVAEFNDPARIGRQWRILLEKIMNKKGRLSTVDSPDASL